MSGKCFADQSACMAECPKPAQCPLPNQLFGPDGMCIPFSDSVPSTAPAFIRSAYADGGWPVPACPKFWFFNAVTRECTPPANGNTGEFIHTEQAGGSIVNNTSCPSNSIRNFYGTPGMVMGTFPQFSGPVQPNLTACAQWP